MNRIKRSRDHSLRIFASPQIERLEERRLLANQFVGGEFAWGGAAVARSDLSSIAAHPDGYLATIYDTGGSRVVKVGPSGATLGAVVEVHPGEVASGFDKVSTSASGAGVVAWIAPSVSASNGKSVASFRLLDAAGQPQGAAIRAHDPTYEDDSNINVDMAADGRFVVSWSTYTDHINARVFAANGQPLSPIILRYGLNSDVAMLPNGGFEMVWEQPRTPTGNGFDIIHQRFNSAGNGLGLSTLVAQRLGYSDTMPSIEADSRGRVAIVWMHDAGYTSQSVKMRGFDEAGQPLSNVARFVSDSSHVSSAPPTVSVDDSGRSVVVWTGDDASGTGVFARQMTISGLPLGAEFIVNRSEESDQTAIAASAKADSFVVGWSGGFGQMFNDGGVAKSLSGTSTFQLDAGGAAKHQALIMDFDSRFAGRPSVAAVQVTNRVTGQSAGYLPVIWDIAANRRSVTLSPLGNARFPDGDYKLYLRRAFFADEAGNLSTAPDLEVSFFVLNGDLNRDRQVSISDFIDLASNMGKTQASYAHGDLNYDGTVSISDFIDLSASMNRSYPATTPDAPRLNTIHPVLPTGPAGAVFDDVNADGRQDPGEAGTPNITVFQDVNGNGTPDPDEASSVTDSTGTYYIPYPAVVLPAGYSRSIPICTSICITYDVIGLHRSSTMTGLVFEDLDRDGARDENEPGIADISVYAALNPQGVRTRTNSDGTFVLAEVPTSNQTVGFDLSGFVRSSFTQSGSTIVVGAVRIPEGARGVSSVEGRVFADANGNGIMDAGERPFAGALVGARQVYDFTLPDGGASNYYSTRTDADGRFVIEGMSANEYDIRVEPPIVDLRAQTREEMFSGIFPQPGLYITSPQLRFRVGAFENRTVDLPSQVLNVIAGTIVERLPNNTTRPVIGTLYLDRNNNGSLDEGEPWTPSNSTGQYWIQSMPPGSYTLRLLDSYGLRIVWPSANVLITAESVIAMHIITQGGLAGESNVDGTVTISDFIDLAARMGTVLSEPAAPAMAAAGDAVRAELAPVALEVVDSEDLREEKSRRPAKRKVADEKSRPRLRRRHHVRRPMLLRARD